MRLFGWIAERLTFSRHRPELRQAMRTSDELLETKRRLVQFSDDLQAGHIRGQHKVLHITQSDFLDDELFGERKDIFQ